MTTPIRIVLLLLVLLVAYLLFWPVAVEPVAWQAPAAPALEGRYATNHALAAIKPIAKGEGIGPESVAMDIDGNIYTGFEDGRIVRFDAAGGKADTLTNTRGRPLGMAFSADGKLIIADGYKGLLSLDVNSGRLEVLADAADGVPFGFTDDLDIARDGTIYFSDASSKFSPAQKARDDVIEHGGHGRLLAYDPATGQTRVLLSGLQFANGVALSQNEDSVLVTETGSYDIVRYWLKGEKAGTHDIFFSNLPGIPDGISSSRHGTFWVALYAPRNAALDALSDWPMLRKIVFRLPQFLQPQPARHAFILGLNEAGEVTHNLQYRSMKSFAPITSVLQRDQRLYLGSLERSSIGVYSLTVENETVDH